MRNSLRSDITTTQNLAVGALSYTTSFARRFKLEQIVFKASVSISEIITITYLSPKGSSYDTILKSVALSSSQNYVFVPEGQNNFQAADKIKIQCTNSNGTGVVYVTIKMSEVLQ